MRIIFLFIILFLISLSLHAEEKVNRNPEVWMIHLKPELLTESGAKWDFCKKNVNAMEFFINTLIWLSPEQTSNIVKVLKENRIKIGIECGLFDWDNKVMTDWNVEPSKIVQDIARTTFDDQVGEETARIEMGKIKKLVDAGGTPDYLNLDGSIRRMMRPGQDLSRMDIKGFKSMDKAIDEMVDYMKAWRKQYPKIRFFALTNFPNWGWKGSVSYRGGMFNGDYYDVIKQIINRTKAAGIPISGVTADNPYEYTIGIRSHDPWLNYTDQTKPTRETDPIKVDWMTRLIDLEKYVENQGLDFNLILNTETAAMTSDEASCSGTLAYLDAYRKAGGSPKRYIVQNWFKHPEKLTPETEPNTYTWMVKRVIEKVKSGARGQGSGVGESLLKPQIGAD